MRKFGVLFALLAAVGLATPPAEAAVVVKFQPSANYVDVGGLVTIDMLANIGQDTPVIGFDLNVGFNSGIASLVGVSFGSAWDPFSFNIGNQLIGLAPYDNDSGQLTVTGNDVLLASLTFSGDVAGSTELTALFDPDFFQGFALMEIGAFAEVTVEPGSLRVPEPTTLALLLPALLGVGMLARRRKPA